MPALVADGASAPVQADEKAPFLDTCSALDPPPDFDREIVGKVEQLAYSPKFNLGYDVGLLRCFRRGAAPGSGRVILRHLEGSFVAFWCSGSVPGCGRSRS